MEMVFNFLLVSHIAGGTAALLSGAAAIVTRKGSKAHSIAGRIYVWGMNLAWGSALPMSLIHPNLFLFAVGIFSGYQVLTGWRAIQHKRHGKTQADDALAVVAILTGIGMIATGGYAWAIKGEVGVPSVMMVVFGSICALMAYQDLTTYLRRIAHEPHRWIFQHFTRMLGGYIATWTAFLVVNLTFLPGLVIWLAPTLIGSLGISLTVRHYRKKMGLS